MNPLNIIEKYYQKHTQLYDILVSHSNSVTAKALEIARKHRELGCDFDFIKEAAMLHDIGIFLTSAPSIHCHGTHQYIEHGYLGAELLRKEELEAHALVCERHTGTGLSLEYIIKEKLPLPHRDMQPVTIEEQLICYADLFFSKTRLEQEIPLEKVKQKVAHWGKESVETFRDWAERMGN
ncbi:MAG: HDIG domain-containing protein [Prevotellaceae bacterium]|jgi:uncharacterized protein|nr:HDIG domain-containing protein [Prevotellaceae bacterium]